MVFSYITVSRLVFLSFLMGGGVGFLVVSNNALAAEPLVLSNAGVPGGTPRTGGVSGLYWDVKQSDGVVAVIGDKPVFQCTATKHIAPRFELKLTGGDFAISQIEVISDRLVLPRVKTVPVMISFNRGLGDLRTTGVVLSSSRLVIRVPNPKAIYDQFNQSTAMRVGVELGSEVRTALYDLTGLRTALADLETCIATPVSMPMSDAIKMASPPPVPMRTPAALIEAEQKESNGPNNNSDSSMVKGDRPDVTVGMKNIPALDWPEIDPPTLRMRAAPVAEQDVPSSEPTVLPDVAPSVVLPVGNKVNTERPFIPGEAYSPARARVQKQMMRATESSGIAASPDAAPPSVISPARENLIISGPAPVVQESPRISSGPAITWRAGEHRFDVQTVETYRARTGERLRDVLRRWADRGGIDLVWNMPGDVVLDKDFSHVGAFKDALKGLVAAYPQSGITTTFAADGMGFERQPFVEETRAPTAPPSSLPGPALDDFAPNVKGISPAVPTPVRAEVSAPQVRSLVPVIPRRAMMAAPVFDDAGVVNTPLSQQQQMQPVVLPSLAAPRDVAAPVLPASPPTPIGPVKRWRALSGASMRQVILAWAEEAQVTVMWSSQRDYAVRYSVNKSTDFGSAVADLFAQYARDPNRPQGQIYNDVAGGARTLVVR